MVETEFLKHLGYEKMNFGVIDVYFEEYVNENVTIKYYPDSNLYRLVIYSVTTGKILKLHNKQTFEELSENFVLFVEEDFKLFKRKYTIDKILNNDIS